MKKKNNLGARFGDGVALAVSAQGQGFPSPPRTRYTDILAINPQNLRTRNGFGACECVGL